MKKCTHNTVQEHTVNTIIKIRQHLKELTQMAHGANNASDLYFMKTAQQSVQSGRRELRLAGMINYCHLCL